MPDIDLDFQSDRRDEVKAYLENKYGKEHVANVGAYQTFKPRAAIQKVGRVFDIYTPIYTEEIDPTENRDLEHLRRVSERVDEFANKYPEAWRHALRVQKQVHTQSKHAGAVVVTDRPIADYMPTMRGKSGESVTQWGARADFNIIDEYGFMKIDLLGIKGLAMQEYACNMIEQRTGERIKLNELPIMRDGNACETDVLEAFNKGLVLGVFQFTGSSGFARLIRHIGADWLGDLGAANAIYRPGPLGGGVDRSYAARKQGKEDVNYYHESAEACLKETYGLIVYQEQIMELAKQMAGFTGGEADTFRKAISKEYRLGLEHVKKFLEDKGFKEKWQQGCSDNGIEPAVFNHVWDLILAFGDYGFNKSHAYAYAVQSYQDMYLKVKYPTEFYAALLTFDPELAPRAIREGRYFNARFLSPDVNKSSFGFTVTDKGIRFGLKAVKNLGDVGVKMVLENQPFRSYDDFVDRIPPKAVNKRARESLVNAGAFDDFGMRKHWTSDDKSLAEKSTIGIAISDSEILSKYQEVVRAQANSFEHLLNYEDNSGMVVGGEIISVKGIKSKRGPMGFFSVELDGEEFNCTAFTNEWDQFRDLIEIGKPVMVRGRKNTRKNGDISIIVDQMCSVEELVLALASETYESDTRRDNCEDQE
jgi:DNA polymerase-3 subunit alpha